MAVTLNRANGFTKTYTEADLISTLHLMQSGDLYQVVDDNVFTLRVDPGHLCLMDACQQNLDITSLYNVSWDDLLPYNLRFTSLSLSDSVNLDEVLASLGKPSISQLSDAFMVTFSKILPRSLRWHIDESSQETSFVKRVSTTTIKRTGLPRCNS